MIFQSIPRERVIAVIEKLGPCQPLEVRRELGEGDTVLIGAILSEMAHTGKIGISKTKRGGSPFYYLPDKPEMLERISEFLNEKDRTTFQILKERRVLREDELDPLTRVSLSNIPDFSRRFFVDDAPYWHYYLVTEEDARRLITPPKREEPKVEEKIEEKQIEKKETQQKLPAKKEVVVEDPDNDPLYQKVVRFVKDGVLQETHQVKQGVQIEGLLMTRGEYGQITYFFVAFSRKTLPETLVWKALLDAKSKGLPLLILKDSLFPKSLQKKFSDVPNVYFEKI